MTTRSALPRDFFARPAAVVSRELLGATIVSTVDGRLCRSRIVETEAYVGPDDEASHAASRIGRTKRNQAMFGPPGRAYVYRIYGVHWCLNAVTDEADFPAAVLIRAGEPLEGIEIARSRRGDRPDLHLMRGPGNLCSALGVTAALDHHPLDEPPLVFERGTPVSADSIAVGPRVGVTRSADLPLRFWIAGCPWVSDPMTRLKGMPDRPVNSLSSARDDDEHPRP
jgi:DNA-3-methyladenine glycosylase